MARTVMIDAFGGLKESGMEAPWFDLQQLRKSLMLMGSRSQNFTWPILHYPHLKYLIKLVIRWF